MFFLVSLAMRPDLLLWIWPIFVPMLFAPRIAAWTSSRAAGEKARLKNLLLTPEERAAMVAASAEPHHGGEVVPMPVRAVNPALMAAEIYVTLLSGYGLGHLLHFGRELNAMDQVIGVMLVIVLIGLAADKVLFSPWERFLYRRRGIGR